MRHGTNAKHMRGNQIKTCKLTEGEVLSMRAAFRAGETMMSLSRRYGMSMSQTYRIVHGYCWQYLGGTE